MLLAHRGASNAWSFPRVVPGAWLRGLGGQWSDLPGITPGHREAMTRAGTTQAQAASNTDRLIQGGHPCLR